MSLINVLKQINDYYYCLSLSKTYTSKLETRFEEESLEICNTGVFLVKTPAVKGIF